MHTEGNLALRFESASSRKIVTVSLLAEIQSRNLLSCLPEADGATSASSYPNKVAQNTI